MAINRIIIILFLSIERVKCEFGLKFLRNTPDSSSNKLFDRFLLSTDFSPVVDHVVSEISDHDKGTSSTLHEVNSESVGGSLDCRDSVREFLDYSTDVKDECNGLRKAFEMTCSGDTTSSDDKDKSDVLNQSHARRKLQGWDNEYLLPRSNADIIKDSDSVAKNQPSWIVSHLRKKTISARRYITQLVDSNMEEDSVRSNTDPNKDEDGVDNEKQKEGEIDLGDELVVADVEEKPKISPSLPSTTGDLGSHMLSHAVTLADGTSNEAINIVLETLDHTLSSNSTKNNNTSSSGKPLSLAEKDAAASTEAISAATAAISAVLNSPEAIEARTCCESILKVYHKECDNPDNEEYNDSKISLIVCVVAICGMVKSVINYFKIRWLPEAGGCILVGVIGGIFLQTVPHFDFGFEHDMFLRLMVPPIVFEAALSIDKREFKFHWLPIAMFSIFGTLLCALLTAAIVYYGTSTVPWCTSIPFVESLTFGALISSIDPVAVLSVLRNVGMTDTDPIYVLIFGESLLNDGVSIVLFQTLVRFLDDNIVIDGNAITDGVINVVTIALGSLSTGMICGTMATAYFCLMEGIQTPLVEVLVFLCWAFLPYYISDGVEWSGIVTIVCMGIFMDVYIIGDKFSEKRSIEELSVPSLEENRSFFQKLFSKAGFMSEKARGHIGFVSEINSTIMETAIFAYLGLFLCSSRYHWTFWVPFMAILACLVSRAIMIFTLSSLCNWIKKHRKTTIMHEVKKCIGRDQNGVLGDHIDRTNNHFIIDMRMQIVLLFAGMRGAMSFALVEAIPLYDAVSGQGSRMKPELKAMTSASIIFTIFILGGYTYYLLVNLGITNIKDEDITELTTRLINTNTQSEIKPNPLRRKMIHRCSRQN